MTAAQQIFVHIVIFPQKGYGSHAMTLLTEYYSEASVHADYVDTAPTEQQLAHVVQDPQVGATEDRYL